MCFEPSGSCGHKVTTIYPQCSTAALPPSKWFISGESDDNRSLSEMDGDGRELLCDNDCCGRPSDDDSWMHLSDYEGREKSCDEKNGRKCASYTDVQKAVSNTNKFPPVFTSQITMTK